MISQNRAVKALIPIFLIAMLTVSAVGLVASDVDAIDRQHTDSNTPDSAPATFSPGTEAEPLWELKCYISDIRNYFKDKESPKIYIAIRSEVEITGESILPIAGVEEYPGLSLTDPWNHVSGEVSKIGSFDLTYMSGGNDDIYSVEVIVVDYVDSDFGDFYSKTLSLSYTGEGATSILWDFGDGTSTSTEWEPEHTYAEKGTYYIKQTASNSAGDSVAVYKINIMGYPVITLDSNGGSAVADIAQTSPSAAAVAPTDPVRDGYTFDGWYSDEALTAQYDWATEVETHITLYAKWTAAPTYTVTLDADGGEVADEYVYGLEGSSVVLPYPIRDGYTFDGWYAGDVKVDAEDFTIVEDVTLIAHWTETAGEAPVDPVDPEIPDESELSDETTKSFDWIFWVSAICIAFGVIFAITVVRK